MFEMIEREREGEKEMVTSNDVDGKLNDFSHVKIHRHQTSIEITEKKKNDDEATNASSRYCRVLISNVLFNRSFFFSIEPRLKSLFLINWSEKK